MCSYFSVSASNTHADEIEIVWGVRRLPRLLPLISRPIYLFTFVPWVYLADLLIIGLPGIPLRILLPQLLHFSGVLNYI